MGGGHGDVLVDAEDGLRVRDAERLGVGEGLPERRRVHARIDEEVADALVVQHGHELGRGRSH